MENAMVPASLLLRVIQNTYTTARTILHSKSNRLRIETITIIHLVVTITMQLSHLFGSSDIKDLMNNFNIIIY